VGLPGLRSSIANNAPGDSVKVDVWRDGENLSRRVTLGNLPPSMVERREVLRALRSFGISDLQDADSGVVISSLLAPSDATRAGLRPDSRVISVEGEAVTSVQEFVDALAERGLHQGREVTVTFENARGSGVDVKLQVR
jgi:S1-C subfamily serine protease